MNQILMTDNSGQNNNEFQFNNNIQRNNKPKNKEPMQIKSVVRMFAIIILLFGLILSGSGAYAVITEINDQKNAVIPTVSTTKQGAEIKINVSSSAGIDSVSYSWNNNGSVAVSGQNKTQVELSTNIPAVGTTQVNTLNIEVTDSKDHKTKFVKNYVQENSDTEKPTIDFENVDKNVKITIEDNEELDTIVYQIGDDEPKEVKADEGQNKVEITLPVEQGQQTIRIEATDKAGNKEEKTQEVKGATEPKIEVTVDSTDPSYLIIKVHDDDAIKMVAYYINDVLYQTNPDVPLGTTDFEYRQKVEKGENKVKINAYNVSEQVSEFDGIYNY